ncbi:MAG: zinc metalloprotease HtpX [Anaerolineae bacterium]|nr:zinc metalloprotease HtpX [Anaerolineae bacterium]
MDGTIKTVLLLGALTAVLVVAGGLIGGQSGMMIAFVFAIVMNMGAWWFSDQVALSLNRAREVSPAEAPELHHLVESLAARAGLPKPRVYVVESEQPNAFATGRDPQHAAVAVTTGLLRLLPQDEIAGVLAHELAHVKNHDTLIASVAATLAGAITLLAGIGRFGLFFGGRDNDNPFGLIGALLAIILAPLAALVIQLAISRSREFSADAGGAEIVGDPLPLADALEKLEWTSGRVRTASEVNPATAHLFIVNPLRSGDLASLFSTHPSTAERVRRLRAMHV